MCVVFFDVVHHQSMIWSTRWFFVFFLFDIVIPCYPDIKWIEGDSPLLFYSNFLNQMTASDYLMFLPFQSRDIRANMGNIKVSHVYFIFDYFQQAGETFSPFVNNALHMSLSAAHNQVKSIRLRHGIFARLKWKNPITKFLAFPLMRIEIKDMSSIMTGIFRIVSKVGIDCIPKVLNCFAYTSSFELWQDRQSSRWTAR